MQNVINSFKSTAHNFAEYLTPVTNVSKFRETGTVTPEEFVAAGDHLCHHCPSWEWATGDESKIKPYLPKEKQFLITRNMACSQRCKQIEYVGEECMVEEEDDQDGGWVETYVNETASGLEDKVSEMTLDSSKNLEIDGDDDTTQENTEENEEDDDDEDDEAVDMEDFEESGKLAKVDPATATITRKKPIAVKATSSEVDTDSVVRTRTYDLHITFDKLYQTPRLWIIGYDENRTLLTVEQMYEDVSQDHVKKTVTMESHPHIPGPNMLSVHPCKHAHVMKKIIQNVEDGGGELGVHMYLIIFLKFVQTVIPTIEYDFTMNFSL